MPLSPLLLLVACASTTLDDSNQTPHSSADTGDISELPDDAEVADDSTGVVLFNEVMADFTGGSDPATSGDWFELVNLGTTDIDMSRVVIASRVNGGEDLSKARAPSNCDLSLSPGDHLLVYAGHVLEEDTCWVDEALVFGGDALSAWVLDESNTAADWTLSNRVEWNGLEGVISLARYPDTTGPWLVDESPTPRAAND